MSAAPRIQFRKLQGFPSHTSLDDIEKSIETQTFLQAATEIVTVIETFGKLFSPVTSDMNGNIIKITKTYEKDPEKYHYLQELVLRTVSEGNNVAADALLWLKRGLQLICTFFENIYNDAQKSEALKNHLQDAYDKTLKPYHGFIVQNTIKIIYSWVPTRSQLIGQGEAHEDNIQVMAIFLLTMRQHLTKIDNLLKEHNLDNPKKA